MPVPQFLAHVLIPHSRITTLCAIKFDRAARVLSRWPVVKSASNRRQSYTPSGGGGGPDKEALKFDALEGAECLDVLKGRGKKLWEGAAIKKKDASRAATSNDGGGGGFLCVLTLRKGAGEVLLRFDTDEASHTFTEMVNHIASNSGVGRGWLPDSATFPLDDAPARRHSLQSTFWKISFCSLSFNQSELVHSLQHA